MQHTKDTNTIKKDTNTSQKKKKINHSTAMWSTQQRRRNLSINLQNETTINNKPRHWSDTRQVIVANNNNNKHKTTNPLPLPQLLSPSSHSSPKLWRVNRQEAGRALARADARSRLVITSARLTSSSSAPLGREARPSMHFSCAVWRWWAGARAVEERAKRSRCHSGSENNRDVYEQQPWLVHSQAAWRPQSLTEANYGVWVSSPFLFSLFRAYDTVTGDGDGGVKKTYKHLIFFYLI